MQAGGGSTGVTAFCSRQQVRSLVCDPSAHKLLILCGQSSDQEGDLILQAGTFSYQRFAEILEEPQVSGEGAWGLAPARRGQGWRLRGGCVHPRPGRR